METIDAIEGWKSGIKLQIAQLQSSAADGGRCREVCNCTEAVKHLGEMIDDRLNFNSHVGYGCEKSETAMNAIGRIMPNLGGSSNSTGRN